MGAKLYELDATNLGGFNPRTRDGCELSLTLLSLRQQSFNPRTRDGCEKSFELDVMSPRVSIHAPVMGAKKLS